MWQPDLVSVYFGGDVSVKASVSRMISTPVNKNISPIGTNLG